MYLDSRIRLPGSQFYCDMHCPVPANNVVDVGYFPESKKLCSKNNHQYL